MRPINNAVDELFQPRELAEDEYLNEADGLMYCSKCHTPRQHRIELKERVPSYGSMPLSAGNIRQRRSRTQASGISHSGVTLEDKRIAGQIPA